jgi:hypothetical protein
MPNLDYKAAHKFVREQRRIGNVVRWDGWDMVFWKPTRHGFSTVNGSFDKTRGRWGVESRIAVNNSGEWSIPNKYVKQPTR